MSHNTRVVIAETDREFDAIVSRAAADASLSPAEYRASLSGAIAGTPDQCVEQIQDYVDSGITYFFLLFPDPIPSDRLELFAGEVMPKFNDTTA